MAKGNRTKSTAVAIPPPTDSAPIDDIPHAKRQRQRTTFAALVSSNDGANFELEDIASLFNVEGKNGRKLLSASARKSLKQSIKCANSLRRSLEKLSTETSFFKAVQVLNEKMLANHERIQIDHRADLFEETEFGNGIAYRLEEKQWGRIVRCSEIPIEAKPHIERAIGYYLWVSPSADLIYPVTYKKLQQLSLWADKVRDGVKDLVDAPDTFEALRIGAAKDVPLAKDQLEIMQGEISQSCTTCSLQLRMRYKDRSNE